MRAIPERLRGVFTARRYTNQRLPYLTLHYLTLPYLTLPYLTLPYLTYTVHYSHQNCSYELNALEFS